MQDLRGLLIGYKKPENTKGGITQEFQSFALHLAQSLDDMKHKGVYMRMAKREPRGLLESALSFVIDSSARNRGSLFMWKVKQLKEARKYLV